MQTASFGLS